MSLSRLTIKALIFLTLLSSTFVSGILLFPANSVIQITSSFAAPVEIPDRKLYMDWGLQMNYDLPYNPASFYNVPIWSNSRGQRELLLPDNRNTSFQANGISQGPADKYDNGNRVGMHANDFSAGELYESFENTLEGYGFDETCLLRSVCELARHPFADDHQNFITELITFVLTPSLHMGFLPSEHIYREVYEAAERHGFMGEDCGRLYSACKQDFLSAITKILSMNIHT